MITAYQVNKNVSPFSLLYNTQADRSGPFAGAVCCFPQFLGQFSAKKAEKGSLQKVHGKVMKSPHLYSMITL
jgi:hypothetical protein